MPFHGVMTNDRTPMPPELGSLPTGAEPDPAPEREPTPFITDPRDRGGTGEHVGANNIAEGRVDGVMTPPGAGGGEGG